MERLLKPYEGKYQTIDAEFLNENQYYNSFNNQGYPNSNFENNNYIPDFNPTMDNQYYGSNDYKYGKDVTNFNEMPKYDNFNNKFKMGFSGNSSNDTNSSGNNTVLWIIVIFVLIVLVAILITTIINTILISNLFFSKI